MRILSACCKVQQGRVTAENRTSAGRIALPDVKAGGSVMRLWTGGAVGLDYFLMENLSKTGIDATLPRSGLLVYRKHSA